MIRRSAPAMVLLLGGLIAGSQIAVGDNLYPAMPPPGASMGPSQAPNPYASAWPPPGASMGQPPPYYSPPGPPAGQPDPNAHTFDAARTNWVAPANSAAPPPLAVVPATVDNSHESTWYYRLDSFYWNERSGGVDFVNEYGPISTMGTFTAAAWSGTDSSCSAGPWPTTAPPNTGRPGPATE